MKLKLYLNFDLDLYFKFDFCTLPDLKLNNLEKNVTDKAVCRTDTAVCRSDTSLTRLVFAELTRLFAEVSRLPKCLTIRLRSGGGENLFDCAQRNRAQRF